MSVHNIIWDLIGKKLSGEASPEDLSRLEELLRSQPDMHYPLQTLEDLWHHPIPAAEDADRAFAVHMDRMKAMGLDITPLATDIESASRPSRKSKYLFLVLAAACLLTGFYYSRHLFFPAPAKAPAVQLADKSEVSTKYGSRTKLLLPDGSQVWLNSGSRLSYNKAYGNGIREVSLSGEAFFDVVKNPALPFVIHTSTIDIRVLGTAFNVKSFPGEKNTETSLLRGSIEVTFKNGPSGKIILKPNEKLITSNEIMVKETLPARPALQATSAPAKAAAHQEPLVMVSHLSYAPGDSTLAETSWMDNKLIFRSETFEDLAVRMERWYGVHIRFADEAIKPKRVSGIFENETIQQALEALQLVTRFAYKMNRNEILISSK